MSNRNKTLLIVGVFFILAMLCGIVGLDMLGFILAIAGLLIPVVALQNEASKDSNHVKWDWEIENETIIPDDDEQE